MNKFKCPECDNTYTKIKSLSMHRSKMHNIPGQITYNEYVLTDSPPTCKCGCGENTKFRGFNNGYNEYIRGHIARIKNNWGHNPEALKKSHITQKNMYDSGELVIWNKGLTIDDGRVKDNIDKMLSHPERSRKISEALTGIERTQEVKDKLSEKSKIRWSRPGEREKQRYRRLKYLKSGQQTNKSKLETYFEEILSDMDIKFETQYEVDGYLFDFYVPGNNILIEVDGDFYHFNPEKYSKPLYPIQETTVRNDKIKNYVAENNGYELFRFWENDIYNRFESVQNKLEKLK